MQNNYTEKDISKQYNKLETCIDDERQFKTAIVHKRLVTPLFGNGFSAITS